MKAPILGFSALAYPQGDVLQFFAGNKELYSKSVCFAGNCLQGHNGWDIAGEWGSPIFFVESGTVVEAKHDTTGYGKNVRTVNFATGNEWTYGHLSHIDCVLGQEITEGQQTGLMGNTGFVVSGTTEYWKYNPYAGTHLHLGLRKVEAAGATWNNQYSSGVRSTILNYDNGFFGGVDPMPLFSPYAKFIFTRDLKYGERSSDVAELQKRLGVEPTKFYGPLTKQAVLDYQTKHLTLSFYERYVLKGSSVGPKTRASLNA